MGNTSSSKKQKKNSKKKKELKDKDNDKTPSNTDYDWILECMVEFIESSECSIFVDGFIDEHCLVFDKNINGDVDHATFEYKQIHMEYKQMIEQLLISRLSKLGLTPQQFTESCHKAKHTKLNSNILQYIIAIDDFNIFQNIMIQRNIELEKEALKYLNHQQQKPSDPNQMTEDEQIAWALSESLAVSQQQSPQRQRISLQPEQPPAVNDNNNNNVESTDLQHETSITAPSAPMLSHESSMQPQPPLNENDKEEEVNNGDVDGFEKFADLDMFQPKRKSLAPLKLKKKGNVEISESSQNDDELPMLSAASIQSIKRKQSLNQNASILKQKQMILQMRKKKRNQEIEILEPGSPQWSMQKINKLKKLDTSNSNQSTLPPLHKSLFAKMVQDEDNDEPDIGYTLQ